MFYKNFINNHKKLLHLLKLKSVSEKAWKKIHALMLKYSDLFIVSAT